MRRTENVGGVKVLGPVGGRFSGPSSGCLSPRLLLILGLRYLLRLQWPSENLFSGFDARGGALANRGWSYSYDAAEVLEN